MLGELEYVNPYGRQYRPSNHIDDIKLAAESITLIFDQEKNKTAFDLAREKIQEAEAIAFLGFGCHPLNLSRLGISDLKNKTIYGTAWEYRDREILQFKNRFPCKTQIENTSILEMLRNNPILLD
jgi:hypothetical protein